MHEAQTHESNYFVTLTYREPAPRELDHKHWQDFMKRLRRRFAIWDPTQASWVPRYYMCGEYGDKKDRPHYHACLFGITLPDLIKYDEKLSTSKTLDALWTHGECKIGTLTFESAQYVAGYCLKKITGDEAKEHYTKVDLETGEVYERKPEYGKMSLNPAIGKNWVEKYINDVYNYDHVVISGKTAKPPRYYDKIMKGKDKYRMEEIKERRNEKAKEKTEQLTPARLQAIERCTRARLKLKQRTL